MIPPCSDSVFATNDAGLEGADPRGRGPRGSRVRPLRGLPVAADPNRVARADAVGSGP